MTYICSCWVPVLWVSHRFGQFPVGKTGSPSRGTGKRSPSPTDTHVSISACICAHMVLNEIEIVLPLSIITHGQRSRFIFVTFLPGTLTSEQFTLIERYLRSNTHSARHILCLRMRQQCRRPVPMAGVYVNWFCGTAPPHGSALSKPPLTCAEYF